MYGIHSVLPQSDCYSINVTPGIADNVHPYGYGAVM